ncbi:hypothetical protein ACKGJI_04250 [Sulfurospirillum sp. 1307]|jgi:Zn-finger protein
MTYSQWVKEHAKKHQKILKKLKDKSDDEVVEYFFYENMQKNEKDFCLLYSEHKKCHDMKNLNCYLCACPYFRFRDGGFDKIGGKTIYSFCSINSKHGKTFETDDAIHQDCSECIIPHKKNFIKKVFGRNWSEIMKDSDA